MFPTEPRAAIAAMPYLMDAPPRDTLMVVAFGADGRVLEQRAYGVDGPRPLDDPLLESSLWDEERAFAAAVLYTDIPNFSLAPLAAAWAHRGRTVLHALWAGPTRWRSFTCTTDTCCPPRGNRYAARLAGHDDHAPLADRPLQPNLAIAWRRARFAEWRTACASVGMGTPLETVMLERLAQSLFDIPVRDAVLAASATPDGNLRPGLDRILGDIIERSTLGASIPAHTCTAALAYLDGNASAADQHVARILDAEEYSLARLLRNGLEMRAPASLLARSFSHFDPDELLAA